MKELENELWLPVVGYPHYEVSNFGRVKSIDKHVQYKRRNKSGNIALENAFIKGIILKPGSNKKGYWSVALSRFDESLRKSDTKTIAVHRLVAMAFIGNPENKPSVNHIDCNKKNNCVSNLEWSTQKENVAHAKINNKIKTGDGSPVAKINSDNVRLIRSLSVVGHSNRAIADILGVSPSCIWSVINKRTWAHVQ